MNKKLLLALLILTFVIYEYVMNADDEEGDEEQEETLRQKIFHFLENLGIMLGTDLFFKGLAKAIRSQMTKSAEKAAAKAAEKAAAEAAAKEGTKIIETEAERLARREAERIAQQEADRLAETEAERLARLEAERLAQMEADKLTEEEAAKLAKYEADRLAKEEAAKLAEAEAEKVAKAESERLAKEEAERLAAKEADKLAEEELQRLAVLELEQTAQAELLKLTEEQLAKKGLVKVGERVVVKAAEKTAAKMTSMLAKLAGGPWEWISFGISTTLYLALGLDSGMFDECPDDEWSFTHLPEEVLMVINAIPFFGDAWQLIGELVCFKKTCPEGQESSNSLCYQPCKESFKSDGATMCYKQYGDYWENKGFPAAPTITSITNTVLPNTGTPPTNCPPGQEFFGGLCRPTCRDGYDGVLDTCHARIITVGNSVGNVPKVRPCGPDQRDDKTVCWARSGEICGPDCSKGWDNCATTEWNALKCKRGSDKGSWGCYKDNFITGPCGNDFKKTWTCDEYGDWNCLSGCPTSCSPEYLGARTELNDRLYCDDPNQEMIGLTCYDKCPEGMEHPPGMPNQCRTKGEISYYRGVPSTPFCDYTQSEDSLGLCYNDPPPNFQKTTLGMISDICPPGTGSFGTGCTRESYNRGAGTIPFSVHMKTRNNYWGKKGDDIPAGL
jgi:hypothetical protein